MLKLSSLVGTGYCREKSRSLGLKGTGYLMHSLMHSLMHYLMQKQKKTETDQKYFEPEMRDKHYVSYMIVIIFFLFKRRTCECGCFFLPFCVSCVATHIQLRL